MYFNWFIKAKLLFLFTFGSKETGGSQQGFLLVQIGEERIN
jgi:hypothetical protein